MNNRSHKFPTIPHLILKSGVLIFGFPMRFLRAYPHFPHFPHLFFTLREGIFIFFAFPKTIYFSIYIYLIEKSGDCGDCGDLTLIFGFPMRFLPFSKSGDFSSLSGDSGDLFFKRQVVVCRDRLVGAFQCYAAWRSETRDHVLHGIVIAVFFDILFFRRP